MPQATRLKIERDVREVLSSPAVKEKLLSAGLDISGTNQADYINLIQRYSERVDPTIKELGIKIN